MACLLSSYSLYERCSLLKDQGNDVLDALGLIVLSPKDPRRTFAAVQTSDRILY